MYRYLSYVVSTLCLALLTACSALIPPGIPSGMTRASGRPAPDYPERFVYSIDDNRYITIKGNGNCEGTIYYYDARLGIRTVVAATGLTLGEGEFAGYYAANSDYVVIPAIVFSQMSGALIHIHYSRDGGRTFKWFRTGGHVSGKYSSEENIVILNGKDLYVARRDSRYPSQGIYFARIYDVSQDIEVGDDQKAILPNGRLIDGQLVPMTVKSPSGLTKWVCGSESAKARPQ